jgi:hypothetical protein
VLRELAGTFRIKVCHALTTICGDRYGKPNAEGRNERNAHGSETQCRVHDLVDRLACGGSGVSERDLYRLFAVADDIASAAIPEPMVGILRRLDNGPQRTRYLGYRNRGGTLDTAGLLFANGVTWAHIVLEACKSMDLDNADFLSKEESLAFPARGDPRVVMR